MRNFNPDTETPVLDLDITKAYTKWAKMELRVAEMKVRAAKAKLEAVKLEQKRDVQISRGMIPKYIDNNLNLELWHVDQKEEASEKA